MVDKPSWLTRMENGGIGEVRTKAFLIDRFWILERSVDVQGADFIIQRRLTSQNLLDEKPPRLGVIQVKFIQDERTTQYIHREYIYDNVGQPRKEFFLMFHSGLHDQKRQFLLSAEEIVNNFQIVSEGQVKENNFAISGKEILSSSRFEILSNERALDKIENSLRLADFLKNRRFMSWVLPSYSDFTPQDIDDKYLVELDNWWGDIPESFYELKKKIEILLGDFMEILEPLNRVLMETDPSKALDILEDLYYRKGDRNIIQFKVEFYNSDFHSVVIQHNEKYQNLSESGLLDRFLNLQREFIRFVCSDLTQKMNLDSNLAYVVDVHYNLATLENHTFKSYILPKDDLTKPIINEHDGLRGVLKSEPGFIKVFFIPGRFGFKNQENSENQSTEFWKQQIREKIWVIKNPLMEQIYNNIYGIEIV